MVFIDLHHERRQSVHFGVTEHPTAAWVVGIASVVIGVTGRYWARCTELLRQDGVASHGSRPAAPAAGPAGDNSGVVPESPRR